MAVVDRYQVERALAYKYGDIECDRVVADGERSRRVQPIRYGQALSGVQAIIPAGDLFDETDWPCAS